MSHFLISCFLFSGVFVRIKDKNLHVDCFKCATCGTSLKNQGYFNINNKLYCDVHAKLAATQSQPSGTEGYRPALIQPWVFFWSIYLSISRSIKHIDQLELHVKIDWSKQTCVRCARCFVVLPIWAIIAPIKSVFFSNQLINCFVFSSIFSLHLETPSLVQAPFRLHWVNIQTAV